MMQVWISRIPRDAIQVIMDVDGAPSGVVLCTTCMAMQSGIISLGAHFPIIIRGDLICFTLFSNYYLLSPVLQTPPPGLKFTDTIPNRTTTT